MELRDDKAHVVRGTRYLLDRYDWVYLLSLLIPFVVYDLALKASLVASLPESPRLLGGLGLMRSDLLFDLGYASLWVGLFAMFKTGLPRRIVVVLFHLLTILVALVVTATYQYFKTTGSMPDLDLALAALSSLAGNGGAIASGVTLGLLVLVVTGLAYAILGPWILTRALRRRNGRPDVGVRSNAVPWLGIFGLFLASYAMFSFSFFPGGPASAGKAFSRDSFVSVVMTGTEKTAAEEPAPTTADKLAAKGQPPPDASLVATRSERRNVVFVHLESTRALSTTPYNEDLKTTPFLDELAKKSILAENARAVVPHTSNALVATMCGVDPPLDPQGTDSLGDRIPATCLPELLKGQGYNSVYFTSSVQTFERRPEVVKNMGYEDFYPVETMDKKGFQQANYFGYEDDIMLKPSERWLQENRDKPFVAAYETITPHHDYQAPDRYGIKDFAKDDQLNRYQNSVRYVDFFLKNLFDQYKKLGLYDNTVFVIYGDHGEGFGEHGLYQHDNTIYDEGLKIPLLILDPRQFQGGARVKVPTSQLDVLPTVTDLLGYRIKGGAYDGASWLGPMPTERTLMSSCWNERDCLASVKGTEKYVYHFGDKPDEVFDLAKDPGEKNNLAKERPEVVEERRRELLEWRAKVNAAYAEEDP